MSTETPKQIVASLLAVVASASAFLTVAMPHLIRGLWGLALAAGMVAGSIGLAWTVRREGKSWNTALLIAAWIGGGTFFLLYGTLWFFGVFLISVY